jgi:hypothetical protein
MHAIVLLLIYHETQYQHIALDALHFIIGLFLVDLTKALTDSRIHSLDQT